MFDWLTIFINVNIPLTSFWFINNKRNGIFAISPICVWWWRRLAGSGRQGGGSGEVRGRIGSRGVRARRRRRRADAALSRLSLAELVPSAQCARTERDGEKFLIGKWKKKET